MSMNASEGTANTGNEGSANSGEGSGVSIEERLAALEAENRALKSTNERVVNESKSNKAKARELELAKTQQEQELAERDGSTKKLLELERRRNQDLQKSLETTKQSTIKANIKAAVAKYAPDAVDLEDLLNQPKFLPILMGGVDEESLSVSDDAAKNFVAELYKAKPYLRKHSDLATTAGKVGGRGKSFGGGSELKDLTNSQLIAMALGNES